MTVVRIPGDELFQESLWAEIELKDNDKLLVGVIYRSPICSLENHQHLRTLVQIANEQGASHLLIMGDFNYGDINWTSGTTPSELTNPATAFRETLRDMYLYQHVNEPTHYRAQQHPNTLDHIITNEEGMVDNLSLSAPVGKSSHTFRLHKLYRSTVQTCVEGVGYNTFPLDHAVLVRSDICHLGRHGDMRAYVWHT